MARCKKCGDNNEQSLQRSLARYTSMITANAISGSVPLRYLGGRKGRFDEHGPITGRRAKFGDGDYQVNFVDAKDALALVNRSSGEPYELVLDHPEADYATVKSIADALGLEMPDIDDSGEGDSNEGGEAENSLPSVLTSDNPFDTGDGTGSEANPSEVTEPVELKMSNAATKLLDGLEIDWDKLTVSGKDGSVTKKDAEAYLESINQEG